MKEESETFKHPRAQNSFIYARIEKIKELFKHFSFGREEISERRPTSKVAPEMASHKRQNGGRSGENLAEIN
jgi:hypothetical protein